MKAKNGLKRMTILAKGKRFTQWLKHFHLNKWR